MKIKIYSAVTIFSVAVAMLCNQQPVNSKIANAPPASAGNPTGNKTCNQSGCHTGSSVITATNQISIKMSETLGGLSGAPDISTASTYVPGTTYFMSLGINVNASAYGFQIIGQDNTDAQAGDFVATNTTNTQIMTESGTNKKYMGHKAAGTTKNWAFKWTAPATNVGPITFYATINQGNGNQDESGDVIYKTAITISPSTVGINEIAGVNNLRVFPNPISNEFGVTFQNETSRPMNIRLMNLNGEVVKELFDGEVAEGTVTERFNAEALPQGIYMMQIRSGNQSITQKLFKQ